MNIRDLKYLVAVAELKHFGKAAQACFVSQPTLSMQLKKLEDELAVQIFERNNKQVLITATGQDIVNQARSVLREIEQLKTIAQMASNPFAGTFRLGLIPTIAPYLLPHIMATVKKQLPKLELYLIEEKTERLIDLLKQGDIDAAILALPIHETEFAQQPLFAEAFYVALPKTHPLNKKATLKISDLKDETVLLLEDGHCLRDQALEVCGLTKVHEKSGFRATSLETLRHMVAAGSGITLLPELAIQKSSPRVHSVNVVPFSKPIPKRDVAMIWRKNSSRLEVITSLANIIKQQVSKVNA